MVLLKTKLRQTKNSQKNYTNKLLEYLKNAKYIHLLKDNIWGADLADMQLISKFDKGSNPIFNYMLLIVTGNMHGMFL